MKRFLLTTALLIATVVTANAQPRFCMEKSSTWMWGPKVGFTSSAVNGLTGAKPRYGVTAGLFATKPVCRWYAVQTELLYSEQGFNITTEDAGKEVKNKYRLNYIMMPVLSKFYITPGLNFEIGGAVGYAVERKIEIDGKRHKIGGDVNRFAAGIMTGLAYDFGCGLVLEGRYNLNLTKVFTTSGDNTRHGSLQFLVGWRFN